MSRKIVAVILAFVLAISLSACGASDQPEASSAPSQTASVPETSSAQPSATPSTLASPSTEPSDEGPSECGGVFWGRSASGAGRDYAHAQFLCGCHFELWGAAGRQLCLAGDLHHAQHLRRVAAGGGGEKQGVISISSQGVLEVLDSCFAQKFDEVPAIGEAYAKRRCDVF